jgi:hypothetical protein
VLLYASSRSNLCYNTLRYNTTTTIHHRQNTLEAAAQIRGAVHMQFTAHDHENSTPSGVSYKKKLAEMKAKRGVEANGGVKSAGSNTATVAAAVVPSPQKVEQSPLEAMAKAAAAASVVPPKPFSPPVSLQKPEISTAPVRTTPVVSTPAPIMQSATPAAAAAAEVPADDDEETRRKVRTLQGLLLKHRGGPGFGAGRLKAPEAQRLENTLEEVARILRAESLGSSSPVAAAQSKPKAVPAGLKPVPAGLKPVPAGLKPVPAGLKPVAALSAPPAPANVAASSSSSSVGPMAGSVACVEAVLKVYKEASPSERELLIVPLREAFMAAASTANKIIAEAELSAHKQAMGTTNAATVTAQPAKESQPMMGFPTSYDVAKPEVPSASSGGSNDAKLEEAYNALVNSSGNGKFGLKNISGDEANELADQLSVMRGVLLEELN